MEYGPVSVSDQGPLLSKGFHSVGKSLLKQIINLVYTSCPQTESVELSPKSVLVVSTEGIGNLPIQSLLRFQCPHSHGAHHLPSPPESHIFSDCELVMSFIFPNGFHHKRSRGQTYNVIHTHTPYSSFLFFVSLA